MFTKKPSYFYDKEAVLEPLKRPDEFKRKTPAKFGGANKHAGYGTRLHSGNEYKTPLAGRNRRTVWNINPRPFKGAHFACFPPELPEICLLASTSEHGCCASCGAPYKRLTEKGDPDPEWQKQCGGDDAGEYHGEAQKDYAAAGAQNASEVKARILEGLRPKITVGWEKTCKCETDEVRPCAVLDPFAGAGTTALVAEKHGRDAILIELSEVYAEMAANRIRNAGYTDVTLHKAK